MGGTILSEDLVRYVGVDFVDESPALRRLREETASQPNPRMQLGLDPAALLTWLTRLIGARRTIEIGTFTGYSALAVAEAMPDDGRVITCDKDEVATAIARRHWQAAGVAHKIELRLGPARDTLDALLAAGGEGGFDLALVDADKTGYDDYYERCLRLLRKDGLVVLDNMLWSGAVAHEPRDGDTAALHALNQKARRDPRVDPVLLTVGDGLLVVRKH